MGLPIQGDPHPSSMSLISSHRSRHLGAKENSFWPQYGWLCGLLQGPEEKQCHLCPADTLCILACASFWVYWLVPMGQGSLMSLHSWQNLRRPPGRHGGWGLTLVVWTRAFACEAVCMNPQSSHLIFLNCHFFFFFYKLKDNTDVKMDRFLLRTLH